MELDFRGLDMDKQRLQEIENVATKTPQEIIQELIQEVKRLKRVEENQLLDLKEVHDKYQRSIHQLNTAMDLLSQVDENKTPDVGLRKEINAFIDAIKTLV